MATVAFASRRNSQNNSNGGYRGDGPQIKFLNALLKEDGSEVLVRFPYNSTSDIQYETCHPVRFPGDKYDRRVICTGEADCPLCNQNVKLETRFFVKLLVYIPNAQGQMEAVPAVWDRPTAFGDIDLRNLMDELMDAETSLSQVVCKIKRTGTGFQNTKYHVSAPRNQSIYPTNIYSDDFSVLDTIDAKKILARPVEKYLEATGQSTATAAPKAEVVDDALPQFVTESAPVQPQMAPQAPVQPQYQQQYQPAPNRVQPASYAQNANYGRPAYNVNAGAAENAQPAQQDARPKRYYTPGE